MNPTVKKFTKVTWFCHLCRKNGRFPGESLSDRASTKEIDEARGAVHKKVSGDHVHSSPNCQATSRDFIEIEVDSLPQSFL